MTTATERIEEQQEEPIAPKPRVRARGHLALIDWEETPTTAAISPKVPASKFTEPLRRSVRDRLYENSIIALLLVTVIAVIASLSHL